MTTKLKPRISVVALAVFAAFANPSAAAPVSWITQANSFWDLAVNWNPGLPGVNDDVLIDVAGARIVTLRSTGGPFVINSLTVGGDDALTISSGSLTINGLPSADNATGASSLARLTHSGGSLGGSGQVTVTGVASLTGSTHTGGGTTILQGATALSGFNLDAGRILRNEGTATLTGGMNLNPTDLAGSGRIENAAGALFDVRTFNLALTASTFATDVSTARIDNAGTFRKGTGGGYSVNVPFINLATGTVELQLGGFSFNAGGTYSGAATMATDTTLTFGAGTHAVNAGATFTGDGTLQLSGAAVQLNAPTTVQSRFTHSSGSLQGSDLTLSGAATTLTGGTHTGPGTTTVTGPSTWSGFNLDAGRVLRNEGVATVIGGLNLNATSAAGTGSILNAAGGTIDVRTFNLSIVASNFAGDSGAGATITNAGIFRKSTGNNYGVAVPFINLATGTIDLVAGSFSFSAGGTHSGAVTLATGTALAWSGGTHTVNAGATFTGDGTLQLSGAAVQLNAPTTVQSRFTHSSGSLQGSDLTLSGAATTLTGGTHTGPGTTTVTGPSTWSGFNLDAGRVLRNEGVATVTGGLNLNATNAAGTGSILNAAGGTIDVRTFNLSMVASSFAGDSGAGATITNAGIFRKSTGNNYGVAVPFINLATGTIDLVAGSFSFSAGGTYNGAVTLASGADLNFSAGTHSIGAGASFTGPGTLALAGASTVIDLLAPTTVESAFSMGGGTIQGADLTLTGSTTVAISSSLGVMSGPAVTRLQGTSTVGGGANNPFGLDAGRVLRNEGIMTITGVLNLNRLDTAGAGRIENAAGAVINVTTFNQSIAASSFAGDTGADALVSNAGTFRKSGPGGYGVAVPFLNLATGTIDVLQGSFNFTGGGTYNGAVTLANNAGLTFSQGTHNVGTGATFTGLGTLTLAGAGTVLNLLAPTTINSRFDMTGGTVGGANLLLNGPYALTISSSLGVLAGPTTTTLAGSGTAGGGPNNTFGLDAGHVLRNQGTMTITGVLDLNRLSTTGSGRIDNAGGALINVQTFNQSIFATNWVATNPLDTGGDARVNNAGTFRKSGPGTYSVFVPFFNTGTVEVLGGGLNIPTFSNGGTVNVAAGTTFTVSGASFVNAGLIQGGGTVVTPAGGMTNAGIIGPGNSPGHLTIDGDLTMASDGVISIELNGISDFDLLTVTGDATLAGELEIVRLAGYAPSIGDSFIVMTFDDRAGTTFDTVSFLGFGNGVQFSVTYRDQDVLLGVTAVPEPEVWGMLLVGLGLLGVVARRRT